MSCFYLYVSTYNNHLLITHASLRSLYVSAPYTHTDANANALLLFLFPPLSPLPPPFTQLVLMVALSLPFYKRNLERMGEKASGKR